MSGQKINIRTQKFTKQEIRIIEESLKEWNYEWIVDIVYVGDKDEDELDVSFTLDEEDLGEFLWVIYGCGNEHVFKN